MGKTIIVTAVVEQQQNNNILDIAEIFANVLRAIHFWWEGGRGGGGPFG